MKNHPTPDTKTGANPRPQAKLTLCAKQKLAKRGARAKAIGGFGVAAPGRVGAQVGPDGGERTNDRLAFPER